MELARNLYCVLFQLFSVLTNDAGLHTSEVFERQLPGREGGAGSRAGEERMGTDWSGVFVTMKMF